MGTPPKSQMSLLPYSSPYYARGAYPYGPYGMTAEEIKKVREAEEKAFMEAESKRKEFMEAEKAIAKEKELSEKLGPYAYGPYGPGPYGAYGYGYPGYAPGFRGYGYGYPGAYGFPY